MSRRFAKAVALALVAGGALTAVASTAAAQTVGGVTARIREVSFDSTGQTRLIVQIAGSDVAGFELTAGDVTLTENGEPIEGLRVEQLFDTNARPVTVALLMDVSASTESGARDAAAAAAKSFVESLPEQVRIALISFADEARLVQDFTTDHGSIMTAIDGLTIGRGTAMNDAVVLAAEVLGRQFNAQRNLLLFSDGVDQGSTASLSQAVEALKRVDAPATTILLAGRSVDDSSLRAIAAAEKPGELLRVEDGTELSAAFGRIAQAISSQWVVTYAGDDRDSSELDLSLTVDVAGVSASDSSVVINRREEAGPTGPEVVDEKPLVGFLANNVGLIVGVATAFLGALLFLIVILQGPAGKTEERALARRLRMYSRTERVKEKQKIEGEGSAFSRSALGRRAVELIERAPWGKKFEEKLQKEIDRAAWPLRASEFILITIGAVVGGFLVGFLLFQQLYWGVLLAVVGGFVPRVVLAQRVAKRTTDFLGQLPDTLQLLAGSLQAGYGFMQALDTVAKEALAPTSQEFSRVLAEARLGMPVEQALEDMADRVGGDDFKWVVIAINIQRQVGGNLAALLITVADTLRERERVRRQIKVLSAEGKLSAYVLIALPFGLFGYLQLVNPEYMGMLTGHVFGKVLIVVSLVLIGLGAVWMRKIIKIDV